MRADKSMVREYGMSMLKLPAKPLPTQWCTGRSDHSRYNTNKTLVALAGKATGARKGRYR